MPIAPPDARQVNAVMPFVPGGVTSAAPFRFAGDSGSRARAIDCLAAASWYEGGDNASMQTAVMQVVLNRVRNPPFPGTICGVVFQGAERTTGCQFTFTCDGAMGRRPSAAAWDRAKRLAAAAIDGSVDPRVGWATHYHTDWVVPYWSRSLDKIAQVGPHIFYRWRGYWGEGRAFRRAFAMPEPNIGRMSGLSGSHEPVAGSPLGGALAPAGTAAAAASADLPTPIKLSGVRDKSLRGALVRGQSPDVFFIQLDPARFAGNYATAALAICKGKPSCTVLGWVEPGAMATALPMSKASGAQLSFYYHRGAGGERSYWNCGQIKRANDAQCLPADVTTLAGVRG